MIKKIVFYPNADDESLEEFSWWETWRKLTNLDACDYLCAGWGYNYCEEFIVNKVTDNDEHVIYTNYPLILLYAFHTYNEEMKRFNVEINFSPDADNNCSFNIHDLTMKEIRPAHNIMKLFINGEFGYTIDDLDPDLKEIIYQREQKKEEENESK